MKFDNGYINPEFVSVSELMDGVNELFLFFYNTTTTTLDVLLMRVIMIFDNKQQSSVSARNKILTRDCKK